MIEDPEKFLFKMIIIGDAGRIVYEIKRIDYRSRKILPFI